jgi:hypothetical protein
MARRNSGQSNLPMFVNWAAAATDESSVDVRSETGVVGSEPGAGVTTSMPLITSVHAHCDLLPSRFGNLTKIPSAGVTTSHF